MKWSKLFWLMGAFPVDGYKKCGKYKVYEIPATDGTTYYYIELRGWTIYESCGA